MDPQRAELSIEKTEKTRKATTLFLIFSVFAGTIVFLLAILHSEVRMRSYIRYPWLDDRPSVLQRIDDLERSVEEIKAAETPSG